MPIPSILLATLLGFQGPSPVGGSCHVDTECNAGLLCVLGTCRAPGGTSTCSIDTECPGDQVCEQGSCRAGGPLAAPGCTANDQCKDGRVCQAGVCAQASAGWGAPEPAPAPAPASVPADTPASTTPAADDGWALAGGIVTLSMMVPVLGLGIGAELTREDQIPAIPLGAAATGLIAAAVPIGAVAGGSARRGAGVRGSLGMRITSWVTYGLALSNAVALIGLGVAEIEPYPGAISLTTALGVTSGALMAGDAFVSHAQARKAMQPRAAGRHFGLSLSTLPGPGRSAIVGLGGRF